MWTWGDCHLLIRLHVEQDSPACGRANSRHSEGEVMGQGVVGDGERCLPIRSDYRVTVDACAGGQPMIEWGHRAVRSCWHAGEHPRSSYVHCLVAAMGEGIAQSLRGPSGLTENVDADRVAHTRGARRDQYTHCQRPDVESVGDRDRRAGLGDSAELRWARSSTSSPQRRRSGRCGTQRRAEDG